MYIFTFTYGDGRVEKFGTLEDSCEVYGDEFSKPWFVFSMDNGVGIVKTEGLLWATITKDLSFTKDLS